MNPVGFPLCSLESSANNRAIEVPGGMSFGGIMCKEPVINTTALRSGHGIVLVLHECDLMDLVAVLDAGIKRKKIQLAYYAEREQKTAAEILEEQIRTGKEIYDILEPMVPVPSKEQMADILKNIWE